MTDTGKVCHRTAVIDAPPPPPQVELALSAAFTSWDKVHLAVTAIVAATAACALLTPRLLAVRLEPLMVGFGTGEAKSALDSLSRMMARRMQSAMGVEGGEPIAAYELRGVLFYVQVSLCAGIMAAALFGPAAAFASLTFWMSNVPEWGAKFISSSGASVALARMGMVAPVLVVMLQFKPVLALWGLPEDKAPLAQAALLLATAVLQAASVSPLAQVSLLPAAVGGRGDCDHENRSRLTPSPSCSDLVKLRPHDVVHSDA